MRHPGPTGAPGCTALHAATTCSCPFSCKSRGICPSCQGRRMGELAATLVDTLPPALPYRQWVFTYPHALRRAMAQEPKLLTAVLGRSLRTLAAYQRRRARVLGLDGVQTAALCAATLRLRDQPQRPRPRHRPGRRSSSSMARRCVRWCCRRRPTPRWPRWPWACTVVSAGSSHVASNRMRPPPSASPRRSITRGRRGAGPARRLLQTEAWPPPARPRCASVDGFGVHANVAPHR
ncbi:MAG: transposase zinc-binding domain-containing protein [Proteobacteria bacterium]|nr:transposase zinc-binding domain-containing protein [Pseudomonadota bacterium]